MFLSQLTQLVYLYFMLRFVKSDDDLCPLSRHLLSSDGTIILTTEVGTTAGPYFEALSDYHNSSDMLAMGMAGSPGLDANRASVVDGIPLELSLCVVNSAASNAPLENVDVFLWHTDAAGVYSDISINRQGTEDTSGQKWLRNVQTTDEDGSVLFRTILPGWYSGRMIHFHVRLRLPGSTVFIATTQLVVGDDDLAVYRGDPRYSINAQSTTPLQQDFLYRNFGADIMDSLTLSLTGSVEEGFVADRVTYGLAVEVDNTTPIPTSGASTPPTGGPTMSPTSESSTPPTGGPSIGPTNGPSIQMGEPTSTSTTGPSIQMDEPTSTPTAGSPTPPTGGPTMSPTSESSTTPTGGPSIGPTNGPSIQMGEPTSTPTTGPSIQMDEPTSTPTTGSPTPPTGETTSTPAVTSGPSEQRMGEPTSNPTSGPSGLPTPTSSSAYKAAPLLFFVCLWVTYFL